MSILGKIFGETKAKGKKDIEKKTDSDKKIKKTAEKTVKKGEKSPKKIEKKSNSKKSDIKSAKTTKNVKEKKLVKTSTKAKKDTHNATTDKKVNNKNLKKISLDKKEVANTKGVKKIKPTSASKPESNIKKEVKTTSNVKNLGGAKANKPIKQTKQYKVIDPYDPTYVDSYIDEEEDKQYIQPEFKSKNEKALEKELEAGDDLLFDEDDDNIDKDPENVNDDDEYDEQAAEEFEKSLVEDKNKPVDIFDGVSTEDPVRMYLKEIGQFSLLTPEREKKLAMKKQKAQNLLKSKKLDEQLPVGDVVLRKLNADEQKIIKEGEISQEQLINCNLRLVVSIAKKYLGHGLSLLDLIQEGNLGLIRGIEKFDHRMGFKLSTYVTWWIRQAVSRALADQSKTIRIPVHMVETINKLNKAKKKLTLQLGCEPTISQIAKEMYPKIDSIEAESKVEEVLQIALDPISLDKPVGDEDDSIVADFIADKNVISPETNAEHVMLKEQISELLSGLKERERKVLMLRFGIEDDHPRTLEEVGKELNVTRERIRQIEDKALRKLKYRAKNLQQLIK